MQASRAFSFDGDGEAFRVASEALRIRLAHLFDPYLAVHSSLIEPLLHQITVYGEMLPRQPLRFLHFLCSESFPRRLGGLVRCGL